MSLLRTGSSAVYLIWRGLHGRTGIQNLSLSIEANKWNIFQLEKKNFVSSTTHVIYYLLYEHRWNTKPFCSHSERHNLLHNYLNNNNVIFTCEDNILFLLVNICFYVKAHLVFYWCLHDNLELYVIQNEYCINCTYPLTMLQIMQR